MHQERTMISFFVSSLVSAPPLFLPLISLITSIVLYFHWHKQTISGVFIVIYGLILIYFVIKSKSKLSRQIALTTLVITSLGLARMAFLTHHFDQFPFDAITIPASLHGSVIHKTKAPSSRLKYRFTIALQSITVNKSQITTPYTIHLYTRANTDIEVGDTVEIHNIRIKNPAAHSYKQYLMKEGIAASAFSNTLDYTIKHRPLYSISRWRFQCRDKILHSFKSALSRPTFAFFSSLFLGEKETCKKEIERIQKQFKLWGALHYLARSGLHLVIVISMYEILIRLLPLSFAIKHMLLLLLGLIYFAFSWPSISFIRAFIIFLFYKFFILFKLPTHFLHILLATCCIILIINPLQLFFLDFQLSFCLTFALGWLNQHRTLQAAQN